MDNSDTQNLTEKIARMLEKNDSSLSLTLENINQRLNRIESQISPESPKSKIRNPKSLHPSQEKFLNLEELADEIINNFHNEKACPYEPAGKPCDNCSMCNSRGF